LTKILAIVHLASVTILSPSESKDKIIHQCISRAILYLWSLSWVIIGEVN